MRWVGRMRAMMPLGFGDAQSSSDLDAPAAPDQSATCSDAELLSAFLRGTLPPTPAGLADPEPWHARRGFGLL
jgi:hypothetical protein